MREDYIKLALLNAICRSEFIESTKSWLPVEQMEDVFHGALAGVFRSIGLDIGLNYKDIIGDVIQDLTYQNALLTEGDEFTGQYFRLVGTNTIKYVNVFRGSNEIGIRVSNLGGDAFVKALRNIAKVDGIDVDISDQEFRSDQDFSAEEMHEFPASDRLVSLNHNQINQFDEQSSEIIEAIESLNVIDGEPGLRELIVGQLKAGRELIRAGSFKIYALQWTLVEGLKFLAARYEKETVGALAGALLAALAKQIGLG